MKALQLHVTGIVQGVGFRPFIYNLAAEQGLTGWVLNSSDGVHCVVEGPAQKVDAFPSLVENRAPAMARVESVSAREVAVSGFPAYEIRESVAREGAMTLVSPDIATCPECIAELNDGVDRRFRYPFINCTNCGPRFTIIDDVPYDRPATTMRDFAMCPECAAEYGDPSNRRFHAQPDACFVCGPRLYLNVTPGAQDPGHLWTPDTESAPRPHRERETEAARGDAIVVEAARMLREGAVLAIKGLGGFHLACDATNPTAVATLRARKHRWSKPLAIMAPDLNIARSLCEVNPQEAELLTGNVRPIVLLRRHAVGPEAVLAPDVAGPLRELGVMLPYTPLHHLLLAAVGRPLVMTSGNRSDEPIATDNQEALARLSALADGFLLHDRAIHSRYDDSVVRVVGGNVVPLRRARGYAPHPISLPFRADLPILAAGPEQKNTFTLIRDDNAFVSQHIGDLENAETLAAFDETLRLYERLFRVKPEVVAHDLHPEYLSTKWALDCGLPTIGVQHHHAHIASVTAEHGIAEKVAGIAFDGTGYGEDGRIWGGEVLAADWSGYRRFAHLRYVPMPGGAAAIRRPARMALGTLSALGLLDHPGAAPLRSRLAQGEERNLLTMVERGVNSPLTSSMGRLFDTVAALIGIADDAGYEGEAAILLEAAADQSAAGAYEFAILDPTAHDTPHIIDPAPVLSAILDDVAAGVSSDAISMRFHRAVVACIVSTGTACAHSLGTQFVALSGGVFMNRLVLDGADSGLCAAGLLPLTHKALPMNDGAISLGQAVVAWARREGR